MANLSDAFGDIVIERVGKEFIDYLKIVQGDEEKAYYKLIDVSELNKAKPNKDGDLSISFSTMGRWNYGTNLDGYLRGVWINFAEDNEARKAYDKLLKAIVKKNGLVDISYTDSDGAMDWMGTGGFRMESVDGELSITDGFDEEPISISGYADINGEDEYWALEYLKGDEVAEVYSKYIENCKKAGKEPEDADTWYDTIYEGEE